MPNPVPGGLPSCKDQGQVQGHTGAQRFVTVSGLKDMFPGNGVQQCLRYVFFCLVGVPKMSAQSAATCIKTMWY